MRPASSDLAEDPGRKEERRWPIVYNINNNMICRSVVLDYHGYILKILFNQS